MFRFDINGIRAIAVLIVVLFHFGISGFSGGFIGVDIFFVISGYLMTKIIFQGIEDQRFSLGSFYYSRCKRIIPPLFTLITSISLVAGTLLYSDPAKLANFTKHAAASMSFLSNIIYWLESGYFDDSAHAKWLLHTWSLSVEWQFYILYPLVILTAKKFIKINRLKWIVLCITVTSIICSILLSKTSPFSAFFLIHTRAWEMLAGGLVFLFPFTINTRLRYPVLISAMLGITYSIIKFNGADIWPGYLAILPTFSTMLLLYLNWQTNPLFNNPVSQFLGRISYSLYLWHWPIVVALHHYQVQQQTEYIILGLLASILLATLSFHLIEKKTLVFSKSSWRNVLIFNSIILFFSVIMYNSGLAYFKSKNDILLISKEQLAKERARYWKGKGGEKPFEKDGESKILVIGNSWAIDLLYALKTNGLKADINFIGTSHYCINFGAVSFTDDRIDMCQSINKKIMDSPYWKNSDAVFLHDFYMNFSIEDIEKRVLQLRRKTNAPIYIFGPKMSYSKSINVILRKATKRGYYSLDEWEKFADNYERPRANQNQQLLKVFDTDHYRELKIHYIDTLSSQCSEKIDCKVLSTSKELLYFDDSHLTLLGSRLLGAQLIKNHPYLTFEAKNTVR